MHCKATLADGTTIDYLRCGDYETKGVEAELGDLKIKLDSTQATGASEFMKAIYELGFEAGKAVILP